jgi:hypothetical protein
MAAPKIAHGGVDARAKKPPKEFRQMILKHGENGGHIATHEFTSYEHEPEHHVFGKHEGAALLAHVAKHMGIDHSEPDVDDDEQE